MSRDRKIQKWQKADHTFKQLLPSWRTKKRVKQLIAAYNITLILGLLVALIAMFWFPFIIAWLLFTISYFICFIMLRIVTGAKDSAPEEFLDEYEYEVLQESRATSNSLLTAVTFIEATLLIFAGVLIDSGTWDIDSPGRIIYFNGLLLLIVFMYIISLPTVTYARRFGPLPARASR